jgi:hypothetical protein
MSEDTAIFDTGSNKKYTVTGSGSAYNVTVSGDAVTFSNFTVSNNSHGVEFDVENSANVTISSNSSLNLYGFFYTGHEGTFNIQQGSTVTVNGTVSAGYLGIAGTLNISGNGASVSGLLYHDAAYGGSDSAGSTINITNGGSLYGPFNSINGTINIDGSGSVFNSGGSAYWHELNASGLITGSNGAVLNGGVTNHATIEATKGDFKITGELQGSGTLKIDNNATLELGGDSDNNVTFLNHAMLQLDKGIKETGFLQGFTNNDTIDLKDQNVTSVSETISGNVTTVDFYDGSTLAQELKFNGSYSANDLYVHSDGKGGTIIEYQNGTTHKDDLFVSQTS